MALTISMEKIGLWGTQRYHESFGRGCRILNERGLLLVFFAKGGRGRKGRKGGRGGRGGRGGNANLTFLPFLPFNLF